MVTDAEVDWSYVLSIALAVKTRALVVMFAVEVVEVLGV